MYWPKYLFVYCSVGGGELGYVLTQTLSFSISRYGMGNLDMYWPTHWVFLLFGRGWVEKLNIWVNTYRNSPSPYRAIEKLNIWVNKYPNSPCPYRAIICIDPHNEFFYCSVGDGELGYVLTQTLSFSIFRYGIGNLDMHRPKHLVFLLLRTGWGTWICKYTSKFPIPLPSNKTTQCLGLFISKFPIPLPSNRKTQYLGQ
jgi:hypothetical protein